MSYKPFLLSVLSVALLALAAPLTFGQEQQSARASAEQSAEAHESKAAGEGEPQPEPTPAAPAAQERRRIIAPRQFIFTTTFSL